MSKYLKLTYKLVWFEYLDWESISIVGVLSILSYFRHVTFDYLNIFISILENLKVSYIIWCS